MMADVDILDRGRMVGPRRPDPFHTTRSYVEMDLNEDDKDRYEKIRTAKDAKVLRTWLLRPDTPSYTDYILTHEELDAIVPITPDELEGTGAITRKQCDRCQQVKHKSQFYVRRASRDGYDSTCRTCLTRSDAPDEGPDHKRCGRCDAIKHIDQFYRSKRGPRKKASWCRSCVAEQKAELRRRQKPPKPALPDDRKKCSRCQQILSRDDDFYRHAGMHDGLSPACKDCDRRRKIEFLARSKAEKTNLRLATPPRLDPERAQQDSPTLVRSRADAKAKTRARAKARAKVWLDMQAKLLGAAWPQTVEKPCCRCGQVKPLVDFYRDPSRMDGRENRCITCYKARRVRSARSQQTRTAVPIEEIA